jgi:hypothetical protein
MMAVKQLMPNQCVPLHFIYGPQNCCLCNARQETIAAKRDLAKKVLAAVDAERLHDNLDNEGDKGYMRAIRDVAEALKQLFAAEGVAVEGE